MSPASGWDALQNLSCAFGILLERFGIVGVHVPRRNRIDVDALRGPFIGEGLGELANAAFGRSVRRHHDTALKREQRGDVNDFAAPALEHVPPRVLRKTKDTG